MAHYVHISDLFSFQDGLWLWLMDKVVDVQQFALCRDLAKPGTLKISADKSNLWYTESKAKFTHTIKMVYTGTATASSCFARSMQSAVLGCVFKIVILNLMR